MTALNFGNVADEVAAWIGTGGNISDDTRTSVKRYINMFGRELWNRHPWPERISETFFATHGPYSTGTVTTTNGSPNLTFSGSTLASWMAGKRFALSTTAPWYRILSVNVGAGTAVLDRDYNEANGSLQAFTIYSDEYDLAPATESVIDVTLLATGFHGRMVQIEERVIDDGAAIPVTRGKPLYWCPTAPIAATPQVRRIRIWPVPDGTYNIRLRSAPFYSDMSGESDAHPFHQDREPVLIMGSVLYAQRLVNEVLVTKEQVDEAIESSWMSTRPVRPRIGRRRAFDRVADMRFRPFGPAQSA